MRWLHFRLPMLITAGTAVGSIMDSRRRTWNMSTGSWAQLVAVLGPIIPLETPVGWRMIPCKDPTYDPKWHKYQPSLTHPMHTTTCLSRQCITQLYLLYTAPRKQTEFYSMRFTGDWQNAEWRKEMGLIHANDNNKARLILDFRGLILIPILFWIFFFCKDPINICNRARIFYSLPTNLTIYNWLKQLTLL